MTHPADPNAPARARHPRIVLLTCCLSLFIVMMDVSGLNLALPAIRRGLGISESRLQWVMDAYTLVLAALLMASGSLADRYGRRRLFRVGLVVFGLGSVLCAASTTGTQLVGARMLQAVGGSMLNPIAMGILSDTFRDRRQRAQAIGIWGATTGLAMALGPVIGGLLVQSFGWEAIFWLNVPVVLAALVLTTVYVPESRAERPRSIDVGGQLLVMGTLTTLTFGIIEGREAGWASPLILGSLGAALVCGLGFVLVERRVAEPVVDLRFFGSVPFSVANICAVAGFVSLAGFLFLNTLYLQTARGYSPVHAGLLTLPMAALGAVFAPLSGRLVGSRGPRWPLVGAGLATAAAGLVLTRMSLTTPVWVLLVAYALYGTGYGLLNAPISNTAISGMPLAQAGVAGSVVGTSRQVGNAMGVALFGTLTFSGLQQGRDLATAMHPAWWVMVALALLTSGLGLVVGTRAAERSAERVAALFGSD